MTPIRILSLNIWNYNDPWPKRLALIAGLIARANPDLVALQEIRYQSWSAQQHQADQILDALDQLGTSRYGSIWQPAAAWPQETRGKQWEGLAILSKNPIVDRMQAKLARDPRDPHNPFDRLVLGAQVETHAGPFWLFDTHYPLSEQARERVASTTLQAITQAANGAPFALVGDLNALPDEPAIHILTEQTPSSELDLKLTDAWVACHPQESGLTHPAWGPEKRIDYVLLSPGVKVIEVTIVGQVVDRDTLSPSDHCGLLAEVQIGH